MRFIKIHCEYEKKIVITQIRARICVIRNHFIPSHGVRAQSGGGDKVTFDLKNAPLTEIFRQIETQTDKRIAYDDSILPGVRIDLAVRNEPVAGVLDKALRNTDLTYQVKGKYVVIAKKGGQQAATLSVSAGVPIRRDRWSVPRSS